MFVPKDDPVRIARLVVTNPGDQPRRLSVTAYAEWVLGEARLRPQPHVVSEKDARTNAVLARSAFPGEFGGRIAFSDLGGRQTSWTCDRTEYLGRNGHRARPRGQFKGTALSGRVGAGLDPCAALRAPLEVPARGRAEITWTLGQGEGREHATSLIERWRTADLDVALAEVRASWDALLGAVGSKRRSLADLLARPLAALQALSCRVWARAGFYQAGGAFGFRDQLQDVMALCQAAPGLVREHLLRAAARQFAEGDVQHWWHPPLGRGVRTRITDDLLWLPYAVAHYVSATGDAAVLDEEVAFLWGNVLREGEDESYFQPVISDRRGSLYEHCARALDRSLATGAHGLPLMGTGDWNDGMNRVGREGKGESVWLAWFLNANLRAFAPFAMARGEPTGPARGSSTGALEAAVDRDAWDGDWYRRLLRRRHAARHGAGQRVPHRLDRAELGGDRGRLERARARRWRRRPPPRARDRAAGAAVHRTVRPHAARSGLHQGLPARHPRERRAVHTPRCGRRSRSPNWATATAHARGRC